jgi:hypothetical protein
MEELFRHRVFKMLMNKGLLSEDRVRLLRSWENSGFNPPGLHGLPRPDADCRGHRGAVRRAGQPGALVAAGCPKAPTAAGRRRRAADFEYVPCED